MANLFKVNYSGDWEDPHAKFDVELTFTWLDWRIVDLLINDPDFHIDQAYQEQE